MSDSELEQNVDEVAGHSTGNTLLVTALAAALIDAGVVPKDALVKTLKTFAEAFSGSDEAIMVKPIEQCIGLLEASAGQHGHTNAMAFSNLCDVLRRMSGEGRAPG